jgi:hypothetical protein
VHSVPSELTALYEVRPLSSGQRLLRYAMTVPPQCSYMRLEWHGQS